MTLWKTPDGVSLDTLADEASIADVLAAVRRGVESGTINGFIEKIRPHYTHDGEWDWECVRAMGCPADAEFIVIRLPVSDGGSET